MLDVGRITTTTEMLGRLDVDFATPKDPARLANVSLPSGEPSSFSFDTYGTNVRRPTLQKVRKNQTHFSTFFRSIGPRSYTTLPPRTAHGSSVAPRPEVAGGLLCYCLRRLNLRMTR